jgi:hypothetical protein
MLITARSMFSKVFWFLNYLVERGLKFSVFIPTTKEFIYVRTEGLSYYQENAKVP